MKYIILILLNSLLIISCTEKIEMESWPVNNILVINSFITPDSLFSCYIGKIKAMPDTNDYYITNAEVAIFDNSTGHQVANLYYIKNGFYRSSVEKPEVNKTYRLEVSVPGFPEAMAITSIPEKTLPDSVYLEICAGEEAVGTIMSYDELNFTINDKNVNADYFEIALASLHWVTFDYQFSNHHHIILDDSIRWVDDYFFIDFTNNDPVIVNEAIMRYNPGAIIFSDELFSNSTHQFTIRCHLNTCSRNYFILYSLSKELYKYRKTFFQHQYEQGIKGISRFDDLTGLDFAGKAIDVYSNMEGAYGIFAGYNYKMKFSPYFVYSILDSTPWITHTGDTAWNYIYNYNNVIYFNKDSINE